MNENNQPLKFSNKKALEVIEPYSPQVIEFESVADFNEYYSKHSREFEGKTTQKLNTKYRIPGYKLTNQKGQLKIIKDYYRKRTEKEPEKETEKESEIKVLTQRVTHLENQLKQITEYLSNMN